MKTLDACFEDWEERMRKAGVREVRVDSIVQLTLKVGRAPACTCSNGGRPQ